MKARVFQKHILRPTVTICTGDALRKQRFSLMLFDKFAKYHARMRKCENYYSPRLRMVAIDWWYISVQIYFHAQWLRGFRGKQGGGA